MQDDDEKLVTAFKNGDESAFTKLYEKYFPIAKNFFLKDALTCNAAEDYCQDIFIKLARALLVSEVISFKSLFYKSLLNKKKDIIRQKYRQNVPILSLFQETSRTNSNSDSHRQVLEMVEEASGITPHDEIQFNELQTIVQNCVDKFHNEKRRLIVSLKLEGLKEHQIAAILHINPHTVSSNWGRAKLILRECILEQIEIGDSDEF